VAGGARVRGSKSLLGGSNLDASQTARFLKGSESLVLTLIAIVLVALSIVLLISGVVTMVVDILNGTIVDAGVEILNGVLLVMMIMEIVGTVTMSLESHTLIAEPFLIIGAIAAIRRMLVITAESTKLELTNPDAFRSLLVELGLLALIVVAMAVAIYILRRGTRPSQGDQPAEAEL
jgi:phosphate starvation-inducible membrane PsiE